MNCHILLTCWQHNTNSGDDKDFQRAFYCEIREIARDSLAQELIPCDKGAGVVYPPKDCWELKGGRRRTQSKSSSSLGSNKKKKADTMRRFKVRIWIYCTETKYLWIFAGARVEWYRELGQRQGWKEEEIKVGGNILELTNKTCKCIKYKVN